MDLVRLRTMTFKSVLNTPKFGKGKTVQNIIDAGRKDYLVYMYYCNQFHSFVPEVLDALGIEECDRIEKPGFDREKYNEMKERRLDSYSYRVKRHHEKAVRVHRMGHALTSIRMTIKTRGYDMYRNQHKIW